MASRLLQWLAPSVEIKGRKVLGQVEAWRRWREMIWREDSQWQVLVGEARSERRCVCVCVSLDSDKTNPVWIRFQIGKIPRSHQIFYLLLLLIKEKTLR